MDKNKFTSYILTGLVCSGITAGICWYFMDYSQKDIIETGKKFAVINECQDFLDGEKYPYKDNDSRIGAINGYLKSVCDEFTFYYQEQDDISFQKDYVNTSGTAFASGFEVDISDDGNILLTLVEEDKTAYEQGLRQGDVIIEINDTSVSETGFENIANKLLGKEGTQVKLRVRRGNNEFDMNFIRSHVYKNECEYETIDDVLIMRIKSFNQLMQGQFDQALREAEKYDNVIIDLRNNPGGDSYVELVLSSAACGKSNLKKYFYNGEEEDQTFEGKGTLVEKNVVLLVNENTASAAEIFTATLKQNINATIVGKNTYGKGVFQGDIDLSDGGKLHYTAGYFTVGDWECWQDKGIAPDIEVEMDSALIGTDEDIQLQKALELLE